MTTTGTAAQLVAPDAPPVQLVLIDGLPVATARVTISGALDLLLTDDQHRAFRDAVVLDRAALVTVTVGDQVVEAVGYVRRRGADLTDEGPVEFVGVKLTGTLATGAA